MEGARRSVPEPELEREWAAVLLGLINRNDVAGLPISVKFTFDAEPRRANVGNRPSYMTDDQFAGVEGRQPGPDFPAHRPVISGLSQRRQALPRGP